MKASDIKKGNVITHDGGAWQVRDIERSAPTARGGNVTFRFTLYSIPDNRKLDLSARADDTLDEIELVRRQADYSYRDGDNYVFMDSETYSQYVLSPEQVGDAVPFIVESEASGVYYVQLIDDAPVGVQIPATVKLTVVETAPALKGASATKRGKPATLDTGLEIQVPEYISRDERVWVNTTTREFSGRA